MNYESKFRNKSSSLNQGEDEEVTDWLSDNPLRFPKDGFPPLCEQGDNISQIKWYNDVCSRETYTIKHWLKGAPEIWAGLHDQRRNGDSIINSLRISLQSKRLARSFEFTRHSSIVGIPVENNTGAKEWTKMARSIMISRILKRWWNSHHILDKKRW